eukprot:359650-Chlamydomonas_euryale.AAC.18
MSAARRRQDRMAHGRAQRRCTKSARQEHAARVLAARPPARRRVAAADSSRGVGSAGGCGCAWAADLAVRWPCGAAEAKWVRGARAFARVGRCRCPLQAAAGGLRVVQSAAAVVQVRCASAREDGTTVVGGLSASASKKRA